MVSGPHFGTEIDCTTQLLLNLLKTLMLSTFPHHMDFHSFLFQISNLNGCRNESERPHKINDINKEYHNIVIIVEFGSFEVWTLQRNMGDSSPACLMQPFCYASGISNEANQSNSIHALGQSISFGRFMSDSESLAWEKWSTFSNNRYVEEAERISRPGSVAQKKAFFEAHYKKLAAQKEAALLEQANNATQTKQEHEAVADNTNNSHMTSPKSKRVVNEENAEVLNSEPDATGYNSTSNIETSLPQSNKVEGAQLEMEDQAFVGNSMVVELQNQLEGVDNDTHKALSEKVTGTPPMDTPKLKQGSNSERKVLQSMGKKKPPVSSFKLLKVIGTSKFTSTPIKSTAPACSNKDNIATSMSNKPALSSADKRRSTPKSLHMSLNFTPIREINRLTALVMRKFESTRVGAASSKASKNSSTPLRNPIKASKNELQKHSSWAPLTEKKRNNMTPPIISSPFSLRTEERIASRKKKLEEKFNANETQKVQLHTKLKEKAEKKIRKLRHSFCFKARPPPEFYKEREASEREIKKDLQIHPESPKQGRRPTSTVVERKIPLPPPRPSLENNGTKNFQGKNGGTKTLPHTSNSTMITTHENTSPNIQHGNQNDRNYK